MILNILNDKVVWRVLLLMSYEKGRGYRYSDLKRSLRISNSSLYKALSKLLFYDIVEKENNVIKINFSNPESEQLFDVIESEKKRFKFLDNKAIEILLDFLSMIDENTSVKSVYLFGSYAKRTNSRESDIDLAIVSEESLDLFEYSYSIERRYGVRIELHYFTEKELGSRGSKLVSNILRDGIKLA